MTIHWQDTGAHIAIAVHSIHQARTFYEHTLGLKFIKEETVVDQQVHVAFYSTGSLMIELIEPLTKESPVAAFLKKRGEGIHHLALGTKHIEQTMQTLTGRGIQFLNDTSTKGADGAHIAFISPSQTHGVLLEVCEKQ
ncbi:methylmalonyl-CoA epimerase [Alkalihalobacillus sp. FSL W8-0930]